MCLRFLNTALYGAVVYAEINSAVYLIIVYAADKLAAFLVCGDAVPPAEYLERTYRIQCGGKAPKIVALSFVPPSAAAVRRSRM